MRFRTPLALYDTAPGSEMRLKSPPEAPAATLRDPGEKNPLCSVWRERVAEIRTVAVQCLVNTLNTEIHIAIQNRLAQKLARIARIARYAVVFSIAYRVSRDTRGIKNK